jgi:putative glutamine amidotransferase
MAKPLIGITANKIVQANNLERSALNESYIKAVLKAGGIPVIIPTGITPDLFDELLGHVGGVLFTGGVDINPACYGEATIPEVDEADDARDQMEIPMVKWVVQNKKPFFGICRGCQMINVALGGTLYTHLYGQFPDALQHTRYPNLPRNLLAHTVQVDGNSTLKHVLGNELVDVNSLHHQGVRTLAAGLKAVAYAPDGLIEGLELPGHPFGIAVQWHPEELIDQAAMLNLFQALVNASSN